MLNDKQTERAAQGREQAEPSEQGRPIPRLFLILALALVLWGAAYIAFSGGFGNPDLGDKRTVADLSGPVPGSGGAQSGVVANGKQLFTSNCVACHQATGKGLPGVFPPLDGSEWVVGDERTVANILLHGVTGDITVSGNSFKGAMPPFNQLNDVELAAVGSYVRSEWSNKAPPIKPELFEAERKASTRTTPFNGGEELKTAMTKLP
jgi:mono/diheme cytochrome c family protein